MVRLGFTMAWMTDTEQNEPLEGGPDAGKTPRPTKDVWPEPTLWQRLRPNWLDDGRLTTVLRWVAAIVWVFIVVGGTGVAYATYDFHKQYDGRILPGAEVVRVDIGGMTFDRALAAVQTAVEPELSRRIELEWKKKTWGVTPRELGAESDARELVEEALNASNRATWVDKAQMRVLGTDDWFVRNAAVIYPEGAVKGFVRGLASGFDREARDATVDYSTGWVEVVPHENGRAMRVGRTAETLQSALENDAHTATVSAKTIKAEVKSHAFDEVLLLRIGENKLYLYEDGEITHDWLVATGQPEYPTPTGIYEITEKRYMPTWVNPDPTGWGADMPASIPPGPSNPLGLRALNWSAPAIRFHGTSATYSLGYNASHGCVRMSNEEVIGLYDMIDVGTPIVSTVVAPLRPLYASAPDPTVVAEDAPDASDGDDAGGSGDRKKKKN